MAGRGTSIDARARRAGRSAGAWALQAALGEVMVVGLTVMLLAAGIAYQAEDDRVRATVRTVAESVEHDELAAGYEVSAERIEDARLAVLRTFPISLVAAGLARHGLALGAALFAVGLGGLLLRVRHGASVAGELGRSLALTGAIMAAIQLVLEWRVIVVVGDALRGEAEIDDGAGEAVAAVLAGLWPLLLVAAASAGSALGLLRGAAGRRPLAPSAVGRRALLAVAVALLAHVVGAATVASVTGGAAVGPTVSPVVLAPLAYTVCVLLFAVGTSLWIGARREERAREAGRS